MSQNIQNTQNLICKVGGMQPLAARKQLVGVLSNININFKTMKSIRNILIICATMCCFVSCKKEVDMTLVQKTVFENADIRQIEIGEAWPVTLVADSLTFVEIEYSAYLDGNVKAKMTGNQLEIGFTGRVHSVIGTTFRATVHTTQLEKLEVNDAAKVSCIGDFVGQQLEIDLSDASLCSNLSFSGTQCDINMDDASILTGFQFVGNTCKADLSDASQYNGQIRVTELFDLELSDASRFVNKGGVTETATVKLRSASLLNMVETEVKTMQVELEAASEATIWANETLTGTLKSGSTLYYKGHPMTNVYCSEGSAMIPL